MEKLLKTGVYRMTLNCDEGGTWVTNIERIHEVHPSCLYPYGAIQIENDEYEDDVTSFSSRYSVTFRGPDFQKACDVLEKYMKMKADVIKSRIDREVVLAIDALGKGAGYED